MSRCISLPRSLRPSPLRVLSVFCKLGKHRCTVSPAIQKTHVCSHSSERAASTENLQGHSIFLTPCVLAPCTCLVRSYLQYHESPVSNNQLREARSGTQGTCLFPKHFLCPSEQTPSSQSWGLGCCWRRGSKLLPQMLQPILSKLTSWGNGSLKDKRAYQKSRLDKYEPFIHQGKKALTEKVDSVMEPMST